MQTSFTEKQLKDKDNQSTEKIFKKCGKFINIRSRQKSDVTFVSIL